MLQDVQKEVHDSIIRRYEESALTVDEILATLERVRIPLLGTKGGEGLFLIDVQTMPAAARLIAERLGINRESQVADIGCGWGGISRLLAFEFGCAIRGVDLTPGSIALAQQLAKVVGLERIAFEVGDAHVLPWPDSSFTHAVAYGLMEHVTDKKAMFLEAYRILRPGGQLGIYTEVYGSGIGDAPHWIEMMMGLGYQVIPVGRLEQNLREVGFAEVQCVDVTETHAKPDWKRMLRCVSGLKGLPPRLVVMREIVRMLLRSCEQKKTTSYVLTALRPGGRC